MSTALLFPGQGAQHVGMLRQLPDTPAAARTRAEARAALAALAAEDAEDAARPRDAGGLGADGAPCPHDALADLDAGNADLFAGSASLDAGEAARTRDAFGGPVAGDAAQLRDVGGAAAGEAHGAKVS